jgi:hypothetical protein
VSVVHLTPQAIAAEERANRRAAHDAEALSELGALELATARRAGLDVGARVLFDVEGFPPLHGRVRGLGSDVEGRAAATVEQIGTGAVVRVPLASVRMVCGVCADCRRLSERTGCMR